MADTLKPISGQDAFDILIEHFLGEDWYVVDPIHTTQVNAIALDEILKKYPKRKRLKITTVLIPPK